MSRDTTITARLDLYRGSSAVTTTPPQAEVFLDDHRLGFSPLRQDNIAAGKHLLKIVTDGFVLVEEKIVIDVGKVLERFLPAGQTLYRQHHLHAAGCAGVDS